LTTGRGPRIRIIPIRPVGAEVNVKGLKREIAGALRQVVAEGQRFVATYPPQRLTASGYRRTGTLRRSWSSKVDVSFGAITGTVGSNANIAPYNVFVQGSPQRPIFRTAGWRGVDDLDSFLQTRVASAVDRAVEKATR
jgi:hypothetical protein